MLVGIGLFLAAGMQVANIAGWSVWENEDNCSIMTNYVGQTTLHVSYNFGLSKTYFTILDPALKSIDKSKEYNLKLLFSKNGAVDRGWGVIKVHGNLDDVGPSLRFTLRSGDALTDLAGSQLLALTTEDDVIVESLNLAGSAGAVDRVRECAKGVWEKNPSDPLAGLGK